MRISEQRLAANRANAQLSTGPSTAEGKATASQNATRHGLLSAKLFLEDEDPGEFQVLFSDLASSLNPIGPLELTLVERIAVTMWRQRRLVQAETASLTLARKPVKVAKDVSSELGRGYGSEIKPNDLTAYDQEREQWCRGVLAEIEGLEAIDLRSVKLNAPLVHAQLLADAEDEPLETYLAGCKGGLTTLVAEMMSWCRQQLREADARPQILTIADQVRSKRVILPAETLELLARYQTTLDNQLYKALRALREAQDWRLKTLEAASETGAAALVDVAVAA